MDLPAQPLGVNLTTTEMWIIGGILSFSMTVIGALILLLIRSYGESIKNEIKGLRFDLRELAAESKSHKDDLSEHQSRLDVKKVRLDNIDERLKLVEKKLLMIKH